VNSDSSSETSTARSALRRLERALAPTTTYRVWFGVALVAGIAVCWIPLFNRLGYESSALFGGVFGPVSAFLTLHAFGGEAAEPLEEGRRRGPAETFALLAVRHLALLVPPFIALAANGLRVRNCDYATGALFWLLIPVGSVVVGQTVGWVVAASIPDRRWVRHLCAAAVVVVSWSTFGLHLALEPPIVGHQLFIGYFSGSIYDEALALPNSLIAYRGWNAAGVVVALSVVEGIRRFQLSRDVRRVAAIGAAALVAFVAVGWQLEELGIGIDREHIQSELGGRLETEHFVIHYPERDRFLDQLDRLAEDHEFRYAEMREFFETDPAGEEKIHSYVYPNREVKGKLMGARSTLVAKIWLGEIHVLWPRYGHHWLAHEIAHVFTEPFGAGPLRLSTMNGVGVNMGMVEGIATAADWPAEDLNPHQAAAALRRLEMAPDLRNIVGASGFWTAASSRAYTTAGSFIRFLVDEYGIEAFKRVYGRGDFRGAYEKSLDALVGEWETFLEGRRLDERALETARYLYRRPSIFGKVCPRTTAEIRRRASIAAARGDVGTMKRLYRRLLKMVPENVDYRIEFARRLLRGGDIEASLEIAQRLLGDDLPPVQRARLLQLEGDARWHRGEPGAAAEAYERCLEQGVPIGQRRLLRAKSLGARRGRKSVRSLAFDYLLGDKPSAVALFAPMEWSRRRPEDPLASYLVGRRLWQHRQWKAAVGYLREGRDRVGGEALAAETERLLGRSLYFQGNFGAARRVFEALREAEAARYRIEADEWIRRVDWRRRNEPFPE